MKKIFLLIIIFLPSVIFAQSSTSSPQKDAAYTEYQHIYPEMINPLIISFYNPTYLLFYPLPAKFQLSFKVNTTYFINSKTDTGIYFAYTHLSILELFQKREITTSNPTIDNNFMPEGFILYSPRDKLPWFSFQAGFMHQSNGQGGWEAYKSVAWNQIYIEPQFHASMDNGYFKAKVRFFIPSDINENKDILNYLGFSVINMSYKTIFANKVGFGVDLMLRKGLKSYYGALELGVSVGPFFFKNWVLPLAIYVQLWTGYGESLYLYNKSYTKIRFGISFPMF